jgi:hypothetical protein
MSPARALEHGSRVDALLSKHRVRCATLLWLALVTIYHLDDSVVEEGDAVANIELPITLLETGTLNFSPRQSPILFFWKSLPPLEPRDDYYVRSWHERHAGKAAGVWYATGHLRFNGPRYFVAQSPVRSTYVNTFSVITGLTFLPLAAVLHELDPSFARKVKVRLAAAKLHAASLVALSAAFIFLIGLRYVRPRFALLIALAYGLGTCVWSIASETLWQQTVNIALLSGASLAFLRALDAKRPTADMLVCGLLLGTATASRPSALLFAGAVAVYVSIRRRPALWPLVAGAIPVPLAVAVYNHYYFGSPLSFAQELVGHRIAYQKTGLENVWQTPLLDGALGLLVSPSRGLLVFSPFLALSFWGAARVFRDRNYAPLRPLVVAAFLTMALQCKWFDWWGGWAYGYRPWLEAVPVLALCLLPVVEAIFRRPWAAVLCSLALGWSLFVQGLGAFAYDKAWNARVLHVVEPPGERKTFFVDEVEARRSADRLGAPPGQTFACNVDLPECRYRLWSLDDNIIQYYWQNYATVREHRLRPAWQELSLQRSAPSAL